MLLSTFQNIYDTHIDIKPCSFELIKFRSFAAATVLNEGKHWTRVRLRSTNMGPMKGFGHLWVKRKNSHVVIHLTIVQKVHQEWFKYFLVKDLLVKDLLVRYSFGHLHGNFPVPLSSSSWTTQVKRDGKSLSHMHKLKFGHQMTPLE